MPSNILNKSTNLDLLRAIAVMFVVVDHVSRFLGYETVLGQDLNWLGRLGVMIFFVHTCTVLMLSLERLNIQTTRAKAFVGFYLRRIFRIYPLSITAIIVVVIAHIPSQSITGPYSISQWTPDNKELIGNFLLISNRWPNNAHNIIGVLWSLPFEVQMYVLLPFLYLFQARYRNLSYLLLLWAFSWLPAMHFGPLQYAPHFLAGVIAYSIAKGGKPARLPAWLFPVLIAALTLVFFLFKPSFVTGAFLCLILGLLLPSFATIKTPSINRVTYTVAKYSYGIYLTHVSLLWLAFHKVPQFKGLAFAVLFVTVPVILFHLVESPMIKLGIQLGNWVSDYRGRSVSIDAVAKTAP
jgi:peptidoglycan/LPS O-acetylase OafA/YrhL